MFLQKITLFFKSHTKTIVVIVVACIAMFTQVTVDAPIQLMLKVTDFATHLFQL